MRVFFSDIETNGFYHDVNKFHCAWIIDLVSGKRKGFRPDQLDEYLDTLERADVVVFHNGIDYDLPVLAKLSQRKLQFNVFDTLVLSRLLDPDMVGGHGLKAWGIRLNEFKGDFGTKDSEVEETWETFSEEMYDYCEQDVVVLAKLYEHLCKKAGFDPMNPPFNMFKFNPKV